MGCENGGHCVVGIDSPEEAILMYHLWDADEAGDHMRCICPTGFGGQYCQAPIAKEGLSCGSYHCLNGGICVETSFLTQDQDGTVQTDYHCDCSNAGADLGTRFGGRFCQYEASEFCTDEDDMEESLQGHLFCVNDGTCRPDVSEGCKCPEGYSGFKCDFRKTPMKTVTSDRVEEPTPVPCGGLYCFNGGTCIDEEFLDDNGNTSTKKTCDCSTAMTVEALFAGNSCQHASTTLCTQPESGAQSLEGVEFCVNGGICSLNGGCDCLHGWTGNRCETHTNLHNDPTAEDCGDRVCYNGGKCVNTTINVEDGSTQTYAECDCLSAFDDEYLYAGTSCQFKSTSLCTDKESIQSSLFCTNHGSCKKNPYQGCDCPEAFVGFSCEYEATSANEYVADNLDQNHDGVVDNHPHTPVECGDSVCHHGGTCLSATIVAEDGSEQEKEVCNCKTAFTNTAAFAGEFCEFRHTILCSQPAEGEIFEDVLFCVNGGTCLEDPEDGCDCPTGWIGRHCEFKEDVAALNEKDEADDLISECGDRYCLNGGFCSISTFNISSGGLTTKEQCDCTSAVTSTDLFAGASCEHKSTTFCTQPANGVDSLEGIKFCVNGGKCKANVNEGCECSSAWTGFHCEFSIEDFEAESVNMDDDVQLVDDFQSCGDGHHCFYGGTCVSFLLNGKEEHKCDCTTAMTDIEAYAGLYCQYQSTSFCGDPDLDTSLLNVHFCVNGGVCKGNSGDGWDGCKCPTGYTGLQCEFTRFDDQNDIEDNIRPFFPQTEDDDGNVDDFNFDDASDWICHLQCQNGGTCAQGAKGLGSLGPVVQDVAHLNQTYDDAFFEHCVCPDGWVGVECDHKIEVCGKGEHFCLHGSSCVSNNERHSCDCSTADEQVGSAGDPPLFAGTSCEHVASDICTIDDPRPGRPFYFCVNGGSCLGFAGGDAPHPGCACVNDWSGESCEIRQRPSQGHSVNTALIGVVVAISATTIVGLFLVAYCIRVRPNRDESSQCLRLRRRRHRSYEAHPSEQVNLAPHKAQGDMAFEASAVSMSSSRDPFASRFSLPPDDEPEISPTHSSGSDNGYSDDDEPKIFIPPQDEDGHLLHNVDFI
jgi:hypothetical protein